MEELDSIFEEEIDEESVLEMFLETNKKITLREYLQFLQEVKALELVPELVLPRNNATKKEVGKVVTVAYQHLKNCKATIESSSIKNFITTLEQELSKRINKSQKPRKRALVQESPQKQFLQAFCAENVPAQPHMQMCFACSHHFVNQEYPNSVVKQKTDEIEKTHSENIKKFNQNPTGKKPRRVPFKFDIMCFCATINCEIFHNCPLCNSKGPQIEVDPVSGARICRCVICSCQCTISCPFTHYQQAKLEFQSQQQQIELRLPELKHKIAENISSPALKAAVSSDVIDMSVPVSAEDRQVFRKYVPEPSNKLPSNENIRSLFYPKSNLSSTKLSLPSSSSSSSADTMHIDSLSTLQKPLPREEFLRFQPQLCERCLALMLAEDDERTRLELNDVLQGMADIDDVVLQHFEKYNRFSPQTLKLCADSAPLTEEQLKAFIKYLRLNIRKGG